MKFDCPRGANCENFECECRHHDEVEATLAQDESAIPSTPSVVVTASRDMGRTASTWVFNAVRLLYRQSRQACDSYWIRALSSEKLRQRRQRAGHVLVKTHEWTDAISAQAFEELRPLLTHVIVSVRDGFPEDPAWMGVASDAVGRRPAAGGAGMAVRH